MAPIRTFLYKPLCVFLWYSTGEDSHYGYGFFAKFCSLVLIPPANSPRGMFFCAFDALLVQAALCCTLFLRVVSRKIARSAGYLRVIEDFYW